LKSKDDSTEKFKNKIVKKESKFELVETFNLPKSISNADLEDVFESISMICYKV
jgi:hypothetical protein